MSNEEDKRTPPSYPSSTHPQPLTPVLTLPEFTIQPHPAKTNNPADLGQDPSQGSSGLVGSNPNALASIGPGIQVLTDEQARGLEKPKSREEVSLRNLGGDLVDGLLIGFSW